MNDNFRNRLEKVRGSWIFLTLSLGVCLMGFIPYGQSAPLWNFTLITLSMILFTCYLTHRDFSADFNDDRKPPPAVISTTDLERAEDYIDQHYSIAAIEYFLKLLTELPRYLLQAREQIQVNGRQINVTTMLTFRCPQSLFAKESAQCTRALLVPIVRVRKGLLFNSFKSFDPSGRRLPALPRWQVHGLTAVVLRTLLESAIVEADSKDAVAQEDTLSEDDRKVLLEIVQNISRVTATGNDHQNKELLEKIEKFNKITPEWKGRVISFCESLNEVYIIAVEMDRQPGNSLLLGYSNTVPVDLSNKRDSILRTKYGLLPTQVDIPNSWASQGDSYHFEVSSSNEELYVYDHRLEILTSRQPFKQEDFTSQWHIQNQSKKGHTIAQLYIRRQGYNSVPDHGATGPPGNSPEPQPVIDDLKSVIEFREIPPGSLGNAVTVALITTLIISYFAVFRIGIDPKSIHNPGSTNQDIPALILTLPAFLAAAAGRSISSERLLIAPLTAFYGLWIIASTSLTAALLYIYSAHRELPLEVSLPCYGYKLTFNLIWVTLSLLSFGTYLHLRKGKREEQERYLRFQRMSILPHGPGGHKIMEEMNHP